MINNLISRTIKNRKGKETINPNTKIYKNTKCKLTLVKATRRQINYEEIFQRLIV